MKSQEEHLKRIGLTDKEIERFKKQEILINLGSFKKDDVDWEHVSIVKAKTFELERTYDILQSTLRVDEFTKKVEMSEDEIREAVATFYDGETEVVKH